MLPLLENSLSLYRSHFLTFQEQFLDFFRSSHEMLLNLVHPFIPLILIRVVGRLEPILATSSMVLWCVALLSHNMKVLSLIPPPGWGLSVWRAWSSLTCFHAFFTVLTSSGHTRLLSLETLLLLVLIGNCSMSLLHVCISLPLSASNGWSLSSSEVSSFFLVVCACELWINLQSLTGD